MKARCEFCRGTGKNTMGVPCGPCRASGEVEVVEKGVLSRGKPRYAFFQGKHLVVGRGKVEEFETLADAYRRRDELLRAEASRRKPGRKRDRAYTKTKEGTDP